MAAQGVHGLWFMVHGFKKTINYRLASSAGRLTTPIKSESTVNRRRLGFSLIELMIVITLFTITTIAVTTSYISFQGREIVKNAALQLKSDLRQAQNSAQSGDKVSNVSGGGGCLSTSGTSVSTTTLGGWYLSIAKESSSYTFGGVCLNSSSFAEPTFGDKATNLPTGVTVSAITCGSNTFTGTDSLSVFFVPLSSSVSFFQNSSNFFDDTTGVLNSGCLTGNGETVITLDSSDGDYEIHISQAGGIYEKKL